MSRHEITAVKDDDPMRKMSCIAIFAALVAAGCFPAFPERAKHADAATDEPLETNKDAATAKTSVDAKVQPGVVVDGSSSGHDVPTAVADAGSMEKGTGPAGKACTAGNMCESGTCVGGVCCDSVCAGKCLGCTKAATGSPDGVCAPVKSGTDPGSSCDESNKATCGLDGTCDGKGACAFWGSEVECGAESCTMGTYKAASRCDGTGACKAGATISCDKLPCEGTRCKGACTSNGDCPSAFYCDKGACLARKANGTQCAEGAECSSGQCVDKFCCQNDCKGACRSCAMAKTGKPNGTCDNALAGEDPHNDCEAAGTTCGLDGACDGKGACRRPGKETVCGLATCTGGFGYSDKRCDGTGACSSPATKEACGAYVCGETACKKNCSDSKSDCASDSYCANTSCVARKPEGEQCQLDVECATGTSCRGRCCKSCTCFGASASNLLAGLNAGFDDIAVPSTWHLESELNDGVISRVDRDANNECPYSGSLQISKTNYIVGYSVCVPVAAGTTYYFGGTVTVQSTYAGSGVYFYLDFFPDKSSCDASNSGARISSEQVSSLRDSLATWTTLRKDAVAPAGSKFASFAFNCNDFDGLTTAVCLFDKLFVSNSAAVSY